MSKTITAVDILKMLSILLLLALPPWFMLIKYIKHRVSKSIRLVMFVVYITATVFTQNILPFIVVILSLYFIRITKDNDEMIYYLRPLNDKRFSIILNGFVFKFVVTLVNLWFAFLLTSFGVKLQEQEIGKILINSGWFKLILLSFMTVIIAPILEEFVFRHILYRGFAKKIGKVLSSVLTSILFTLLHFNLAGSISFFAVGVYNCYLYEKYG
jgi:uncharacterized protein